ncbi:MAG TPA: cupin domain-containing protein [Candidatus Limnocylindria bacterium]|nr:cupin domain-containing protein [Candidatus Limnocylindria bacterium]
MSAPPLERLHAEPGVAGAREALRRAGVDPYAWSNGPGDRYAAHEHATTKLLVCAEGSITFLVGPEEEPVTLEAGDGFVLPAATRHSAAVGPTGCTCLEGHRPRPRAVNVG